MESSEDRLEELRALKNILEGFIRNPGWKHVQEQLNALIRARKIQAFGVDISSLDRAFETAQHQGEIQGLVTAVSLPRILLEDVKADIETLLVTMREEGERNG